MKVFSCWTDGCYTPY